MKTWIEVLHKGQRQPSLQDVTGWPQQEREKLETFLTEENIPWVLAQGERMPDRIEWRRKEGER